MPPAHEQQDPLLLNQPHAAVLLRAIASRCRKGLTTTADAEALEALARQAESQTSHQIHNQTA